MRRYHPCLRHDHEPLRSVPHEFPMLLPYDSDLRHQQSLRGLHCERSVCSQDPCSTSLRSCNRGLRPVHQQYRLFWSNPHLQHDYEHLPSMHRRHRVRRHRPRRLYVSPRRSLCFRLRNRRRHRDQLESTEYVRHERHSPDGHSRDSQWHAHLVVAHESADDHGRQKQRQEVPTLTGIASTTTETATIRVTGGDLYIRGLSVTAGSPGIWATGGNILRLDHVNVSNNTAGGILLDGAGFDIKNTTINN